MLASLFAATVLSCSTLVAVDGDTIRCGPERMRDMGPGSPNKSGYDAPEIGNAKCQKERLLGEQAKLRLQELLDQRGKRVEDSGRRDRYGRPLVIVRLANGMTAGEVLMGEGYAVQWVPGYRADWCGWKSQSGEGVGHGIQISSDNEDRAGSPIERDASRRLRARWPQGGGLHCEPNGKQHITAGIPGSGIHVSEQIRPARTRRKVQREEPAVEEAPAPSGNNLAHTLIGLALIGGFETSPFDKLSNRNSQLCLQKGVS